MPNDQLRYRADCRRIKQTLLLELVVYCICWCVCVQQAVDFDDVLLSCMMYGVTECLLSSQILVERGLPFPDAISFLITEVYPGEGFYISNKVCTYVHYCVPWCIFNHTRFT